MNDNSIHPVFPNKGDEIETLKAQIELLKDFIDDTIDEIEYQVGSNDPLHKMSSRLRYELYEKLK